MAYIAARFKFYQNADRKVQMEAWVTPYSLNQKFKASMIKLATLKDSAAIAKIYNHYIEHTVITFEETRVTDQDIAQRIDSVLSQQLPWLVYCTPDSIVGYAYASQWSERSAYRHTVEVSVYLSPTVCAKGFGTQLYEALFTRLQAQQVHVVIGGATLPNPASVALHEKFGMRKTAHFNQVGYKFGQWWDVGYWQRVFND